MKGKMNEDLFPPAHVMPCQDYSKWHTTTVTLPEHCIGDTFTENHYPPFRVEETSYTQPLLPMCYSGAQSSRGTMCENPQAVLLSRRPK